MAKGSVNLEERLVPTEAASREKVIFERRSLRMRIFLVLKRTLYRVLKLIGIFELARRASARSLRIVSYHGFSLADEHLFSPHTFMRGETFEKRMRFIARSRFSVIPLAEAVDRLERGDFASCAVVITIDDGFHSTLEIAKPVLEKFHFPATVYVTTYYVKRRVPVFGLAVEYIVWKSSSRLLDTSTLGIAKVEKLSMGSVEEKERTARTLVDLGEREMDEAERVDFLRNLAEAVGVDSKSIFERRVFDLLDEDEIRILDLAGFDIQLHTHRHRFPEDAEASLAEITDNRAILERIVSKPLRHFCYPNGEWSPAHFAVLRAAGIKSAVTCDLGLNDPGAEPLALKRFGDSEALSQIEFEAELCGIAEILRKIHRRIAGLARKRAKGQNPRLRNRIRQR